MSKLYRVWWIAAGVVFVGLIVYWAIYIHPMAAVSMAVFVIGATFVLGSILKRIIGR